MTKREKLRELKNPKLNKKLVEFVANGFDITKQIVEVRNRNKLLFKPFSTPELDRLYECGRILRTRHPKAMNVSVALNADVVNSVE